ncbi:MAG: DMP19 family protein [Flavobacterium sp.]
MDKLTEPQKQFYYIQRFEAEVYNGEFSQYFYNSSGDFTHETVTTLKEIGAFTTALILQDAINQFPDKKVPQNRIKRQDILEKIEIQASSLWNNLDEKFYNSEEDLNVLLFEFIKKHKDKF